jgi:hypothetical protein
MSIIIDDVKRIVIIALASDDQLMETLVLKGGNAIDLLWKDRRNSLSRASYDLDFSMEDDFDDELEVIKGRIEKTITNTFAENGLVVFDYKFISKPSQIREHLKDFWGGYNIEFKIATRERYEQVSGDIEKLRRGAVAILPNSSPRIEIEISKYEYVRGKMEVDVAGFTIFVYSAEMIVFEKVRAICQQLPDYSSIIPSHSPRPRARDFYDIHLIMTQHRINPNSDENKQLLASIFSAKRVPLDFIQHIQDHLIIHRQDWQNVLDTVSAKEEIESFDFYVNYFLQEFQPLTFP